jgi:hypothetical protein
MKTLKKQRSRPIWIITYLNKKRRKKIVLKGDFKSKMTKNQPPIMEK